MPELPQIDLAFSGKIDLANEPVAVRYLDKRCEVKILDWRCLDTGSPVLLVAPMGLMSAREFGDDLIGSESGGKEDA